MKRLKRSSELVSILEAMGRPFTLVSTNGTATVKADGFGTVTLTDSALDGAGLRFVKAVKKEIGERMAGEEMPDLGPRDVRYFGAHPVTAVFDDVAEIDLSAAYWNTAHDMGLISGPTWEKGLSADVPKQARLMALGSIASIKTKMRFDGEEYHFEGTQQGDYRGWFFAVAKRVGEVVSDYFEANPDTCLLYWVDAVFVRVSQRGAAREFFAERGYAVKEKAVVSADCRVLPGGGFRMAFKMADGMEKVFQKRGRDEFSDIQKRLAFARELEAVGFLG